MRGIAGKQTRGLPTAARLHVADNTGAKVVQILNVLKLGGTMRRYPAAGVGDMAKVSVKKGTPDTRRQMFNAIIIRQRRNATCVLHVGHNVCIRVLVYATATSVRLRYLRCAMQIKTRNRIHALRPRHNVRAKQCKTASRC